MKTLTLDMGPEGCQRLIQMDLLRKLSKEFFNENNGMKKGLFLWKQVKGSVIVPWPKATWVSEI